MQEYTLSLSEADIDISAEHVTLVAPDFEMTVDINEAMHLKNFNGKVMWKDSQLLLDGQLYKHLASYFEINWKNPTDIMLRIEEGFLSVESMAIDDLDVLASGKITIGKEMDLNVKDKNVRMHNYEGSFRSSVDGLKNTVLFDGIITKFSTEINHLNLELGDN